MSPQPETSAKASRSAASPTCARSEPSPTASRNSAPAVLAGPGPRSRHRSCSHSATCLRVFQREDDVPDDKQAEGKGEPVVHQCGATAVGQGGEPHEVHEYP